MKLIPRHSWRTSRKTFALSIAARRRIIVAVVVIGFVALAVLTVEAQVFHRRASLIAIAALLLSVVSGLNYLRSTRGRS